MTVAYQRMTAEDIDGWIAVRLNMDDLEGLPGHVVAQMRADSRPAISPMGAYRDRATAEADCREYEAIVALDRKPVRLWLDSPGFDYAAPQRVP